MVSIRILLGLVASLATVGAHATDFTSSDVYPADYPTVRAVAHMDKLVRERSGGRHRINVKGQGDLDSENFTIGQVLNGSLDMARVNLAVLSKIVPSTAILSLPYLFQSTAHMRFVLDGPIGDELLADMERHGLIGLCFYDTGPRSYTSSKPIRNVADMRGLNVRVQHSDMSAHVVRAMGAVPMPIPNARIYLALQTGTIDAAENTLSSYAASRHHEVARFYSLTEHSMSPGVLVFSRRTWADLSPEDRTTFRAAAKESVAHMRQQLREYETLARMDAMSSGAQIVTDVDKQSFIDVLKPLYPALVNDSGLQGLLRRIPLTD